MSTARALVERFLQTTVSDTPADLADFYADQVVIEMPFAAPGLVPPRTQASREQLRARFAAGRAVRHYTSLSDVRIHETTDPQTVIAEYTVHGTMTATGAAFALRFVMVMTLRDGLIAHTRDYSDPIAGARALDRLPDLVATLSA